MTPPPVLASGRMVYRWNDKNPEWCWFTPGVSGAHLQSLQRTYTPRWPRAPLIPQLDHEGAQIALRSEASK